VQANLGLDYISKFVTSRSREAITVVRPHLEYHVQFFSLPVLEQVQQKTIRNAQGAEGHDIQEKNMRKLGLCRLGGRKKGWGGESI